MFSSSCLCGAVFRVRLNTKHTQKTHTNTKNTTNTPNTVSDLHIRIKGANKIMAEQTISSFRYAMLNGKSALLVKFILDYFHELGEYKKIVKIPLANFFSRFKIQQNYILTNCVSVHHHRLKPDNAHFHRRISAPVASSAQSIGILNLIKNKNLYTH